MKKKLIFLLIIALVNISFLFSGPPDSKGPNSYCPHQYVRLNAWMGVPVNCDEFTFIGAAVNPGYLITQDFQRQSRPLYILAGTITGYGVYYLLYPFHTTIESLANEKLSGQFSPAELQKAVLYGSVYTGFILINCIILFLSMLLFQKCVTLVSGTWKNKPWLLWACLALLVSNQVGKTFFWTAHQQMFTILTPLACLYTGLSIQYYEWRPKKILSISLVAGLLLLFYGNFLLLLPSILFSYFLKLKNRGKPFTISHFILIPASAIIIFLLPMSGWVGYLKIIGIRFYSYEFSGFRQFIWIIDCLKISSGYFVTRFLNNTLDFIKTTGSLFLYTLFAGLIFLHGRRQRKPIPEITNNYFQLTAKKILFFTFLSFIIFLWLLGFYTDRLTFSLAPLLLYAAVCSINREKMNLATQYVIALLLLVFHAYTIIYTAPYFSQKLFFQ